jgi:hypothetical protein
MLVVIGALAVTGAFAYLTWAVVSLAFVLTAMDDWKGSFSFFGFWFAMWMLCAAAWWYMVGQHVSVNFS